MIILKLSSQSHWLIRDFISPQYEYLLLHSLCLNFSITFYSNILTYLSCFSRLLYIFLYHLSHWSLMITSHHLVELNNIFPTHLSRTLLMFLNHSRRSVLILIHLLWLSSLIFDSLLTYSNDKSSTSLIVTRIWESDWTVNVSSQYLFCVKLKYSWKFT